MFKLLIKRGICSLNARFLAKLYTNQLLRVNWNGQISTSFVTTNGVKQGAILSPLLFCVYMDELLLQLKRSKIGCYIGNMFCGALGYADDISILAPSRNAMKLMLSVCENFGADYDVKFNSSKSQLLVYNPPGNIQHITLNGNDVHVSVNGVHLGHPIGNDCNVSAINQSVRDLVFRTNFVMSRFKSCNSVTRSYMFQTYCTSYYGCPLWRLNGKHIKRFFTTWRKCIRQIWAVPRMTHGRILKHLYGGSSIELQLYSRFLVFMKSMMDSDNSIVSMCSSLCIHSNTNVAINRRLLMSKLNDDGCLLSSNNLSLLRETLKKHDICSNECSAEGSIARELCLMRDGTYDSIFIQDNNTALLNYVCLNWCTFVL